METIIQSIFAQLARLYITWVNRLERKIGYSLEFSYIPNTWIDGWMRFNMTHAWAKHNINATGVNYFTVGNSVSGQSSRFIRNEKQYQSWLGAYLVKFSGDKNFTLQDHFDLAIADQKNWLKSFGDPKPFIEMPEGRAVDPQIIKLGDFEGKLYEFLGGPSHSDVGKNSINIKTRFNMTMMAAVMNMSHPNLKLKGSYFLPKDISANYERVILKGYVAIFELEPKMKFVLYGNGTALLNEQGQETADYYPLLKKDILQAFKSMVIKKL